MIVFLEDNPKRLPSNCGWMQSRIGPEAVLFEDDRAWEVVRSYNDFVKLVKQHFAWITHVSFDHDLGDEHYSIMSQNGDWNKYYATEGHEMTGYDAAKWMKEFFIEKGMPLPKIYVHSLNPVGGQNILNLFN